MDRHKASLILEFVLRQPIEDWLTKDILLRLPIASPLSLHLKKTLLLRCLSSVLSSGHLSDDTLKYLELLEEIERSLGAARASKTLRAAYAAVAAELTAAPLRAGDRPRFLEVVNSFWERRLADLVMSEARRMVGKRLREWRRQILAAVDSQVALEAVLRRATREKAVEALREFVMMALKEMGPPLLELAAKEVGGKPDGGGDEGPHQRTGELEAARMPGVPVEASATAAAAVMESSLGDHPAAVAGAEGTARLPETERYKHSVPSGQADALGDDRISEVVGFLPIREVDHVRKALKSSCADLHKVVEDPLPNALQRAVEIQSSTLGLEKSASAHDANNGQNQTDLEKSATTRDADNGHNLADASTPGPSIPNDLQATGVERSATEDHNGVQCPPKPCSSLLDHNPTACSYEDEDSIEDASDDLLNSLKRPRLSTPRNQRASPLQIYEPRKFVRRRKAKRWAPQEEDALREAVKNHGKGNWKLILQSYPGAFKDRTEVDLKDKWRNLTRSPWK